MLYDRILCATDGFEGSDRALAHAARVARDTGAELHVLHVGEPPLAASTLAGEFIAVPPRERQHRVEHQIARLTGDAHLRVVPQFPPQAHGSIPAQIARVAAEVEADLIVI